MTTETRPARWRPCLLAAAAAILLCACAGPKPLLPRDPSAVHYVDTPLKTLANAAAATPPPTGDISTEALFVMEATSAVEIGSRFGMMVEPRPEAYLTDFLVVLLGDAEGTGLYALLAESRKQMLDGLVMKTPVTARGRLILEQGVAFLVLDDVHKTGDPKKDAPDAYQVPASMKLSVETKPGTSGDAQKATPAAAAAPDANDRDHDSFLNAEDKCPDEPEVFNGVQDDDGCADTGGRPLLAVDDSRKPPSMVPSKPIKMQVTANQPPQVDPSSIPVARAIAQQILGHAGWKVSVGFRPAANMAASKQDATARATELARVIADFAHAKDAAAAADWDQVKDSKDAARLGMGVVVQASAQ